MTDRIMVVDDDTNLRITLQEILMDEGWDVLIAEGGYRAIELASQISFAFVLMDIQMPGKNWVEAFFELKEILPDCPVAMMTGFTSEDLVAKALSGGAMTCFSKPVSIEKNLEFLSETIPQPN